jgi:hypothetical protein
LVNHYSNIGILKKYSLFNWYNIKGGEYIFVGTFEKMDKDEKIIYYVFLKKGLYNGYDNRYYLNFSIFSYYDIYLRGIYEIEEKKEDIIICMDKNREYIMKYLK